MNIPLRALENSLITSLTHSSMTSLVNGVSKATAEKFRSVIGICPKRRDITTDHRHNQTLVVTIIYDNYINNANRK